VAAASGGSSDSARLTAQSSRTSGSGGDSFRMSGSSSQLSEMTIAHGDMDVHTELESAEQAVRDGLHFRHDTLRAPGTDSGRPQLCLSAPWLTPGLRTAIGGKAGAHMRTRCCCG